jgi:tetratricopeptide (TPR) repeat protein
MKPTLLKYSLCIALFLTLALSCAGPSLPVQHDVVISLDNQTAPAIVPSVLTASDNNSAENPYSALLGADDYDRVIVQANAALEGNPEDLSLREKLADAYIARAWYYKVKRLNPYTLNDLTKAVEVAPKYYRSYYELGRFHNNQWQFSIGLLDLNKALSIKPDFAPAYSERGYSNYKNRKYEAALTDVNKAIEIDAADGQFYYMRSLVYRGMGENDLAVSDLETAIRLSKDQSLSEKAAADLLLLRPR